MLTPQGCFVIKLAFVHLFAHAATKVLEAGGDVRDGAAMTEAMKAAAFTGVLQAQVTLDGNSDMIEQ